MRQNRRSTVRFTHPAFALMVGGEASMLHPLAGFSEIDEPFQPVVVLSDCDYDGDIHFILEGDRSQLRGFASELLALLDDESAWSEVQRRAAEYRDEYDEDEEEDEDDD